MSSHSPAVIILVQDGAVRSSGESTVLHLLTGPGGRQQHQRHERRRRRRRGRRRHQRAHS